MNNTSATPRDLKNEDKARFIIDMFNRIVVHYAFWFTEIRHQMGLEKSLDVLDRATEKSMGIQMKRLSKLFGFELENGIPKALLDMDGEQMDSVMEAVAKNWLANDGIWFQSIEFDRGMNDAKRCNDSCWAQFSPYEAHAIKNIGARGKAGA